MCTALPVAPYITRLLRWLQTALWVHRLVCVPPYLWPLKEQDSCGGYKPPFLCTALCVHHLACGPLNKKTSAVATDRLFCAPPCVCATLPVAPETTKLLRWLQTAFCVHRLVCTRLLCAPPCLWPLKEQDSCSGYKPPFVCTALCVHRLLCVPPCLWPQKNKTPAVATDRLLCAPPCGCTTLRVAP